MSTDRELLEMAAKAAGYPIHIIGDEAVIFGLDAGPDGPREWNPLTDDGDALRLANRLKLLVGIDGRFCEVMFSNGGYVKELAGKYDPDPDVRRAIVRAAAEIGRSMP